MEVKSSKLSSVLAASFVLASFGLTHAQQKFEIQGEIRNGNYDQKYIYLQYGANETSITDSALVRKNKFTFKGTAQKGTSAFLSNTLDRTWPQDSKTFVFVYLDGGKLKVSIDPADLSTVEVKGSKPHEDFAEWNKLQEPYLAKLKPLNANYEAKNLEYSKLKRELEALEKKVDDKLAEMTEIREQMSPYTDQIGQLSAAYIRNNPSSYVSPYLLRFSISRTPLEESKALYDAFSPEIKNSTYGLDVAKEIKRIESGSVGSKASVFAKEDINGERFDLASYRGQYVLLDFWASWCVPCRQGNPHLIELHNKYHDKGFEIVGVSDDDSNLPAWKKAVEQDEIHIWKHVLRGLKRTESGYDRSEDVSDLYGISTLPTKILINPDGEIIGRYGSNGSTDADLDAKLKSIFGS